MDAVLLANADVRCPLGRGLQPTEESAVLLLLYLRELFLPGLTWPDLAGLEGRRNGKQQQPAAQHPAWSWIWPEERHDLWC